MRDRGGVLHLLWEAGDDDAPLARLTGRVLRFGLRLTDSAVWRYTDTPADFPRRALAWDNRTDPAALAPSEGVVLAGTLLTHAVASAHRPLTLTARAPDGTVLVAPVDLPLGDVRGEVTFDLRTVPPGRVTVVEQHAGGSGETPYLSDDALRAGEMAGIVEVTVADAHYAAPPAFVAALAARAQPLGYYVVARRWADAEFAQLAVTDAGFAADGRAPIVFERVAADAFGPEELSAALLTGGAPDARVVLFRSTTAVTRQARPRRRLQLTRNGDILVADLPQPGPDRSPAGLIVHVSRP